MKLKIGNILFVSVLLSILNSSCHSKYDFEYNANKNSYIKGVKCLHTNYNLIFTSSRIENSVSLYTTDLVQGDFCNDLLELMKKHSIDFVNYYKDSTIAFYASSNDGIKKKQHILIFEMPNRKIAEKISTDMRVVAKLDTSCYLIEKIISIAN